MTAARLACCLSWGAVAVSAAQPAHGQTACCTAETCATVGAGAECAALGGVLLSGTSCASQPCGVGACCTAVSCAHQNAFNCITSGRDFGGAGSTCIDDPCGIGTGACCNQGTCSIASRATCEASGGRWLGAATTCLMDRCIIGACCRPGRCESMALYECDEIGGVFVPGGDCANDACAVEDNCPSNSLYAQPPDDERTFTAYASELASGHKFFDRFHGLPGGIQRLSWFGFDLQPGTTGILECVEFINQFDVVFYHNDAGRPGPVACQYQLTAQRIVTGLEFAGFSLNEYRLSLPAPCVLTDGWLSIVGRGSSTCWFYWITSSQGDTFSECDPCEDFILNDLSFCLQGTAGGAVGACCDTVSGECADQVDIAECADPGEEFDPNILCDQREAVCTIATGACCFANESCTSATADQCGNQGGHWLGAGSPCDRCPAVGACCFDFENCGLERELNCELDGFRWLGPDSACAACPTQPDCPENSFVSQRPDGPSGFLAGTSEASRGLLRFEDYSGAAGAINSLRWWGFDLEPLGGNAFRDCTESDNTFDVSFHPDLAGTTGPAICSYTLPATRTPTGIIYLGTEMNEYEVVLPQSCILTSGWISIVGRGEPACTFLWQSAGPGTSYCQGCDAPQEGVDLAVCIAGTPGSHTGACCDDETATCQPNISIADCADPGQRFLADQACDALDPPCGSPLGPCCRAGTTCQLDTETECLDSTGTWLGPDGSCADCPCDLSCPIGSPAEGEPACADEYVDAFNAGCLADPPAFSRISLCDSVCGSSGVFLSAGEETPDTDWYSFAVVSPTTLTITVEAEFPAIVAVIDLAAGCADPEVISQKSGSRCERMTLIELLDAGDYAVLVLPRGFADAAECGSAYTLRLQAQTCPGDSDGDGDVDHADWKAMSECLHGAQAPLAPGCEAFDLDGDNDVDLGDAAQFTSSFLPPK